MTQVYTHGEVRTLLRQKAYELFTKIEDDCSDAAVIELVESCHRWSKMLKNVMPPTNAYAQVPRGIVVAG